MKKWILLILIIFFATGCDATYNITINKATIVEELQIYEDNVDKWEQYNNLFSTSFKDAIEDNLNYKLGVFFDEQLEDYVDDNPNYTFYNPKKIDKKNRLGISYNYRFNVDNYNRAYFPKNCFDSIKVYPENGHITISTSKGFKCIGNDVGLSNLTINIRTKYEVEKSNADNKDGNIYSWEINNSNYDEKNIYIHVNTSKISKEKNNIEKNMLKAIFTIGLTLAILLIIVIIFLVNKKKKLENY